MEQTTQNKIYENELLSNLKGNKLEPIEMAQLIDEYLKSQQKLGITIKQIEVKLGTSARVLYKYRAMLKMPKKVLDKYKDCLSFETLSTVAYSLKNKDNLEETLEEIKDKGIKSKQSSYFIAEKNDKNKVCEHILKELREMIAFSRDLQSNIKNLVPEQQKRVRETCDDLVNELNKV